MKVRSFSARFFDILFLILVAVCLCLPLFGIFTKMLPDYPATDNRKLAAMPDPPRLGISEWKRFTEDFESFFNDNFGLRNLLIRLNALISFHVLHKSPVSHAVIGKKGFLFYNGSEDGISFPDFEGKTPFSPAEIAVIKEKMSTLQAELTKRKIHFFVVLTPNKQTIYHEMLPEEVRKKKHGQTRADQISTILPALGIAYLDLRPTLLEAREHEPNQVFYKTDSHWNFLGAFLGYEVIASNIAKTIPHFQPLQRSDFEETVIKDAGEGDIAHMVNMNGTLHDYDIVFTNKRVKRAVAKDSEFGHKSAVYEIPDSSLPKLLMFRDSFSDFLLPYLIEGFSRSVYLWQHNIDFALIDQERPDVVILQFVERYSGVLLE